MKTVTEWEGMYLFNTNYNLSQNDLSAHGCVAKRFKMLTYYVYAPLFHRLAPRPEP